MPQESREHCRPLPLSAPLAAAGRQRMERRATQEGVLHVDRDVAPRNEEVDGLGCLRGWAGGGQVQEALAVALLYVCGG